MHPVMLVVGTRPEGIKMMPVYFALKKASIPVYLCSTTQHANLLTEVFDMFGVKPDIELNIMQQGQDLFHVTQQVLQGMKGLLERIKPSLVLVHGDTTTTMAAGLSAFYKQIPVGHVEAGLRTGDIYSPYPEEFNRVSLGLLAKYHFAPTAVSAANLLAEGKNKNTVFCTGNTVVDALRIIEDEINSGTLKIRSDIEQAIASAQISNQKIVLFTMHRRESFNGGIERMIESMKVFAQKNPDVLFVYPYHPNPAVIRALEKVDLTGVENIFLTEPVGYKDLVYLLFHTDAVATDSGGIQEEAVSLGKHVLILREKSERMEGVWEGLATIIGTNSNFFTQKLYEVLAAKKSIVRRTIYGDGFAAEKIVRIIEQSNDNASRIIHKEQQREFGS
ncbi:MAG: UDP-N-acetylglucosamine 2-epimerase (non-hydrolyzing) [Alteromonas naphthalenivorans]|jgi:UDP-N-acetylglucosamine 2-epimerase (non-hydrolysing)